MNLEKFLQTDTVELGIHHWQVIVWSIVSDFIAHEMNFTFPFLNKGKSHDSQHTENFRL